MISLPDAGGLVVVMLATHRCQLGCSYCEMPLADEDLPLDLVEAVVADLDRRLPAGRPVTFVWHGGEPLLRGVAFFRRIHALQEPMRARRDVGNILQTNGLLLDEAWLDLMAETGDFRPNLSMDGPVTGATRGVDAAAFDRIFAALGARGLGFGLSVVASPELLTHRDEALAWFAARGLEQVGLTPYQGTGRHNASPGLFADLCLDADDRPTLFGRPLLQGLLDQRLRGACRFSSFSDGCHRHLLCVDAQGGLFTCLRGKWSGLWSWGTVQAGGLDAWWAAQAGPPPFRPRPPEACASCDWMARCHGGCPSNALAMNGGADHPDYYCASLQRLFSAADRRLLEEALALAEADCARQPR